MRTIFLPLVPCLLALSCVRHHAADLIFVNGKVWTADPAAPIVEAVAVRGGKILDVGTNDRVRAYAAEQTQIVDLRGRLMLPGFIDNHTHFLEGGFQLKSIDLRHARSSREFADLICRYASASAGRWITGGDWDHDSWPGGRLPTKELIDSCTRTTPVFVSRYDGHMALANSHALRLAGITRDTPDPPGGVIVRNARTGEPTGILKDKAMSLVWSQVPDATGEENLDAARLALAEARRAGLTSIQDVSSDAAIAAYRRLRELGELTCRMYCRLPLAGWERLARAGVKAHDGDEWIRLGCLKAFADGSLGSSTALFFDPYLSEPGTRGLPSEIAIDGSLTRWAVSVDSAGLQLSIHAIGDSANSMVLDLFEQIVSHNRAWDRRFRIEHAQHIHPRDFGRFARLGVVASVQPYHAIDDGRWAEGRIGHERCATTYPFRSFLSSGVTLSFGSDWTVGPLSPLAGIYAAVTRRTTDGKHPEGWFPEQKITVEEAIRAYTTGNAYAAFEENEKGSLRSGMLADGVVLSDDILAIDPARIIDVRVVMTMVGGKIVYSSEP